MHLQLLHKILDAKLKAQKYFNFYSLPSGSSLLSASSPQLILTKRNPVYCKIPWKLKSCHWKWYKNMLLTGYTIYFSLALLLTLETHLYNAASSPRIPITSSCLSASFSFQPIPSGLYYLTNPSFSLFCFYSLWWKQKCLFRKSPPLRKWILVAYEFFRCQLEHETKLLQNTEDNVLSWAN